MKTPTCCLVLILFSFALTAKGQEVIASGGHHAKSGDVQLSWTIGEPVIGTLKAGGYILTQGFHQTRLSASAIDDLPLPGLKLSVYPNPFSDLLHLRIDEGDYSHLQYSLLSLEGKTLREKKINANQTDIEMGSLPDGYYLLQVRDASGKTVKTYKVAKILAP
ncbi:MAG: T9SS type A sorting domain-containing protein [Bacteroidales bacterium]